jgi:hypothetical protein
MEWHFPVFILVSFVAFIGILRMALNRRSTSPPRATVIWVAAVVVIGGMIFARAGTSVGLPVWLYYGLPAMLTWVLPPVVFRMRGGEIARYVPMAVVMAPMIHALFSFVLGWNEYMPFIPVPSIRELMGGA